MEYFCCLFDGFKLMQSMKRITEKLLVDMCVIFSTKYRLQVCLAKLKIKLKVTLFKTCLGVYLFLPLCKHMVFD